MKRQFNQILPLLILGCNLLAGSGTTEMQQGVDLLNRGELVAAGKVFSRIIAAETTTDLERGIAHKHLGTVFFRQGLDAIAEYDNAENCILKELGKNSSKNMAEEYGKLCYQRANCRLTILENEIANTRFNGGVSAFSLIQKYVFPLRKDINLTKKYYPSNEIADIYLLDAEADISEARIWAATNQKKSSQRLYKQSLTKLKKALEKKNIASDAMKKILLRQAIVVMEINSDTKASYSEIVPILQKAVTVKSENIELDNAAVTLFATFVLRYSSNPEKDFPDIKNALLTATEDLEKLREKNIASADFNAKKKYFASRTAVYETLLEYYAQKNDPRSMLCVIEAVKNRAIQDAMNNKALFSSADIDKVQKVLHAKKAMLVSYFIGNSNLWIISMTGGDIVFRKLVNSSDIAKNIVFVTKAFNQPAGRYKVPFAEKEHAVSLSNGLFIHLLSPEINILKNENIEVLYIAPHSVLNYFPFGALVEQVNKDDYEKSIFFAERGIPMLNIPSLHILSSDAKCSGRGKFIFYRSDFSYLPNKGYNPSTKKYDGTYGNLPGTKQEANNVQKALNISAPNVFAEKMATEENLLEVTSAGAAIVHCATHGDLNPDTPLDSFLLLAATTREDGKLQVRELLNRYRGKIKCNLFVMSACNTNRGERNILPGDDVAALSAGILLSGANNVIATHWEASDDTFPQIMTTFYSKKECISNPAWAMAKAVQEFLKSSEYRDPFYWANITIQGRN